jgi:hypothetical protein
MIETLLLIFPFSGVIYHPTRLSILWR